ncbi:HAD hydrolase-like protein [Candidatus Azambacteria bacterium]|nr:HAD hydrolase-like protein [Candidatus Azambacteria bacterium]
MQTQLKAIVFDIGNVLACRLDVCERLVEYSDLSVENIRQRVFGGNLYSMHNIGHIASEDFFVKIAYAMRAKKSLSYEKFKKIWGSVLVQNEDMDFLLLPRIKKNVKLFVISNADKIRWEKAKSLSVMQRYFPDPDQAALSFHHNIAKPDERLYQVILQRAGIGPSEILYVDDNKKHIEAFESLGGLCAEYNCQKDEIDSLADIMDGFNILS